MRRPLNTQHYGPRHGHPLHVTLQGSRQARAHQPPRPTGLCGLRFSERVRASRLQALRSDASLLTASLRRD